MANPVIDSVSPAGPITAQAGAKVKVTVTGHDDDSKQLSLHLVLSDGSGNKSVPVDVPITFNDTLTLEATTSDGTPVSVSGMVATVG